MQYTETVYVNLGVVGDCVFDYEFEVDNDYILEFALEEMTDDVVEGLDDESKETIVKEYLDGLDSAGTLQLFEELLADKSS